MQCRIDRPAPRCYRWSRVRGRVKRPTACVIGVSVLLSINIVLLIAYILALIALTVNVRNSFQLVAQQRELEVGADSASSWPPLDIIVPVKDEESHISATLETIVAQHYPSPRILIVNDRSTDNTALVVQSWQDRYSEIERFDVGQLPAGRFGKPNALHSIAPRLNGEYLAFVDSDLSLHPQCLTTLIRHMLDNDLDWLAAAGKPALSGFWERVIIPVCGAAAMAWYDPRKINDPKWDNAMGTALIVCRRSAYEAIGGHSAVLSTYDEDSELIRIAKRAGQRVHFAVVPQLYSQRYYGGLARTINGTTRTFAGGLKKVWRVLYTINALNFISLFPLGLLIFLTVFALLGGSLPLAPIWAMLAIIHIIISMCLARLVYREVGQPEMAWLHPLGSAMCAYICAKSIDQIVRRKEFNWRGTAHK